MSDGAPPKPPAGLPLEILGAFEERESPEPQGPLYDPALDAPLIPRFMPAGRFHLLGASPYTGKSTLIAQLAAALSSGEDFLGLPVNKKQVRFIFTDRCLDSNRASLEKAGVLGLPTLGLVDTPELLKYEAKAVARGLGPYDLLERCIDYMEAKPGDVIISDVHTNAFCGDIFNHRALGVIMRHTGALCLARRITIIATGYGVKITTDQSAMYMRLCDRIMGAAPLRGSADTLMYLTHPDEFMLGGRVQRFEIASRLSPLKHIDLINKDGVLVVETQAEAMARAKDMVEAAGKKPPACLKILPYVPFTDTDFKAICDDFAKTGKVFSASTVSGWLSDLAEQGEVIKVKHGVWRRRES